MKKKKIYSLITIDKNFDRTFYQYNDLFLEFSRNFKEFYILDLSEILLFKKKNSLKLNKKLFPKNFKFISFKNSSDFLNFSKDKKIISLVNLITKTPSEFRIYYLLKKIKAYLILFNANGRIGGKISFDIKFKNFFKAKRHFFLKGFYYLWRFFTIINLFPKIDLLFTCNKDEIDIFKKGASKKLEDFFKIKFFLYRKIVRINNDSISYIINNQININNHKNNKYIIFADVPINHEDRTSREGKVTKKKVSEYYKNLFQFLNLLSKKFKKKVLITLHPTTYKKPNKDLLKFKKSRNFILSPKKTIDVIKYAEIFVFNVSSSVTHAIAFKKKIINIRSKYLGIHFLEVIERYKKYLNFLSINIDENKPITQKDIQIINNSIINYKKFIKNRMSDGTNLAAYKKMSKVIKKI